MARTWHPLASMLLCAILWTHISCDLDTATQSCNDGLRCPVAARCTADGSACITDGCGNGVIDPRETCDDGNIRDNDACSAECLQICNDGLRCPMGARCTADGSGCITGACGNGVIDRGEVCDDGNVLGADLCSADCLLAGCGTGEGSIDAERDIDILFLVDDSDSMGEEQQSLVENFPRFIEKLQAIPGGLPSVHIGIISSNVGAHPNIPGCRPADSDQGRLQFAFVNQDDPRCADGSLSLDGKFIRDVVVDEETGIRERNYQGDLSSVFSCMARLGVGGCGFEGQLESIRQALNGNLENEGFLRPDAYLAIIIITDEDDCSASDEQMFDPTVTGKDTALGPLDSFRCFEFGVQCDPDEPREPGEKNDCVPREDSPYMPDVQEYVDFVKSLKSDPCKILVAGIIGYDEANPDEPLEVELVEKERVGEVFSLVPACQVLADDGVTVESRATTGVRLRAFLEQFPGRNTIQTICQRDLSGALDLIGDLLANVFDGPT